MAVFLFYFLFIFCLLCFYLNIKTQLFANCFVICILPLRQQCLHTVPVLLVPVSLHQYFNIVLLNVILGAPVSLTTWQYTSHETIRKKLSFNIFTRYLSCWEHYFYLYILLYFLILSLNWLNIWLHELIIALGRFHDKSSSITFQAKQVGKLNITKPNLT